MVRSTRAGLGSLGKYGMIDWLRSWSAKICSPDSDRETKHGEGGAQLRGTSRPGNLGTTFWSAPVLFDDVGSDLCDMRVIVADPGPGHCQV